MKTLEGKFRAEDDKQSSQEKLQKAKVTASRHLLFIRHGQYTLNGKTDEERSLTELGRQQAYLAAQRLKELNLPYSQIVQSTMTRAKQTAQIICKELPDVPVSSSDLLREGLPILPEPSNNKEINNVRAFTDGPRIEAAFRRYFYRATPDQKVDSYEIFVCHANVIRYFVCRALQLPPEAWLRFSLHNCSLTWIAIRPSGRVTVYTVGDCGFIPQGKLTTT
ncbi:serine/threonine-protein phosphatase PGAM5, mitochondrial-like [Panonychus citri]|nr:serine/threonine-protein phosphatase PGAM5, mitochondrial-like [Panonychus citri]